MRLSHSLLLLASSAVIVACSQQPRSIVTSTPQNVPTVTVAEQPSDYSSDYWLQQARQASTSPQQYHAFVEASLAFESEGLWQQAAAVLSQLNPNGMSPSDASRYHLAYARWAYSQSDWDTVVQQLAPRTEQFLTKQSRAEVLALLSSASLNRGDYWRSLTWQIQAQRYQDNDAEQQFITLWQIARQVTRKQLPEIVPNDYDSAGWWRLLVNLHRAIEQPQQRATLLQQWLDSYSDHLAANFVKQRFGDWLTPTVQQQQWVALLPLSGRYQSQGEMIRDGIVAALADHPDVAERVEVQFVDTQQQGTEQQRELIQSLGPQLIIGPLLKEQIGHWVQQPVVGVPHLMLNELDDYPSDSPATQTQWFYALDPEDEANQASTLLATQQFADPLVFAPKTGFGERLVTAFQNTRLEFGDDAAETAYYQSTEDMKQQVQKHLGISASQARIQQVKIAAGEEEIFNQPRSRADIGSIYTPASVEQTRLLKPFIDVNVSPFMTPIPVFASSASHDSAINRLSENDLRGVTFTEIPALLPNSHGYEQLKTFMRLRPSVGIALARLTAMGYDAVSLGRRLPLMQQVPGYHYQGLTGELAIGTQRNSHVVGRTLAWGQFGQHMIETVDNPSAQ
ncbi:hypothetical protein CWI84_07265 [Idiomarina tyrosinivorans]|uniref:Penicillin-binding protein activator n=1 Tax=Idiomarina tyrosinivorans TaxID=1445662 RepID=A0A432ZQG9_9GAMM|nr:penicillin-binding protein activator [Idiomarina tyrosinivorans]RUO80092.1 hypothetical protein CWI84_07265 [Idiomarina tyrosinivorans]